MILNCQVKTSGLWEYGYKRGVECAIMETYPPEG